MATRIQSEFLYRSGPPASLWSFTVCVDSQGNLSVREITDNRGIPVASTVKIPQSVTDDISDAMAQVGALMALTSAVSGTLTFDGESSQTYTFSEALGSDQYRVALCPDTFVPLRVISKSTTSFTVQAGAAFTGTVGFDLFL